jgi:hypothetical protein
LLQNFQHQGRKIASNSFTSFLNFLIMEKLLKFWIIFAAFVLFPKESFSYELVPTGHLILDECNAPAPLDFRMTARGADFIDAAWEPAWANATHTVTVSVANTGGGTNAWDHLYTLNSVSGSSVRLNNMPSGEHYKIQISTNCSDGNSSSDISFFFEKLILDLTVPGRVPVNPVIVPCENIRYDFFSNEWIGFRVTYHLGDQNPISSLFELKIIASKDLTDLYSSTVQIARVSNQNPIKAVTNGGNFPTPTNPLLECVNPFLMHNFLPNLPIDPTIGRVYVKRNLEARLVDLCVYDNLPYWNYDNYSFEVLVAESSLPQPGFNEGNVTILKQELIEKRMLILENPVSDVIQLKSVEGTNQISPLNYLLLNSNGEVIRKSQIKVTSNSLATIPVYELPNGIYFLIVNNELINESFKLIKI